MLDKEPYSEAYHVEAYHGCMRIWRRAAPGLGGIKLGNVRCLTCQAEPKSRNNGGHKCHSKGRAADRRNPRPATNLYSPKSGHERKLLNCVKKLAARVATARQVPFDDTWWFGFREYVKANEEEVSSFASAVVADYLTTHGNTKSAGHVIRSHYLNAFESWGIFVSDGTKQKISEFRKLVWNPCKVSHDSETKREKEVQYETFMPLWWDIIAYLRAVSPDDFRAKLLQIVKHQGQHEGIASHSFAVMKILSNKSDNILSTILRVAVAYLSLLFYTAMRSITGVNVSLDGFATQPDNSVLLTRTEHKCGNARNVSKQVYVRLVQGKDPSQCTLVHLAEYFGITQPLPQQPFTLGFSVHKEGVKRTNSGKLPQNRAIAVLHAAAIACGLENGLSGKKRLHLLRFCTENQLLTKGASPRDREQFIGWNNSVQAKNYTISKQRALESNAPYLMAGRTNKVDPAHAMWDMFDSIPNGDTMSYWQRVLYLVNAAGVPTRSKVDVDPSFKAQMLNHVKKTSRQRQESKDPAVLQKRVRELEQKLQDETTKRAKLELLHQVNTQHPDVTPTSRLEALIEEIAVKRKEADFPAYCEKRFEDLSLLIDASSTPRRSWGVPLSGTHGKSLMRIAKLVAMVRQREWENVSSQKQNWFTYVDRTQSPIPTNSWQAFREFLSKQL